MDMRMIQTFLKVADLENFTKAAGELNYVQSTVTTQIQQLERELGFPLFDRIGKRIYLTPLGREFRPYAEEILRILQQVYTLGKSPNEMRGTLRVGTLESLLFSTLVEVLPQYKRTYPNIDLQIKMGRATDLLMWLKQNQLDMVYLSSNLYTEPDLFCCYKRQEELIFVASPGHPLARKKHVSLCEFLSFPLVVTERSGICYGRLNDLAVSYGLTLNHSLVVDNTKAVADILRNGMELAFLPKYSITKELECASIVQVDVMLDPQTYYSQILYHRGKWVAPFMQGLIDLIDETRPSYESLLSNPDFK